MRFALVILVLVLLLAYVGWHLWLLPPLPAVPVTRLQTVPASVVTSTGVSLPS